MDAKGKTLLRVTTGILDFIMISWVNIILRASTCCMICLLVTGSSVHFVALITYLTAEAQIESWDIKKAHGVQ